MRLSPTRSETMLLTACAALLLAALFGPHLAQPAHAHDFADQRTLWGIPCALDVLSNLPFAFAGALGLSALARVPQAAMDRTQRLCAGLFFTGLLATAAGSAWYHLAPDHAGLAVDRAAMAIAFAGLLGLLAATHVSARAGAAFAGALLLLAPASVLAWFLAGNVLPWALVQFGGMAMVFAVPLLSAARPGALAIRWSLVLAAYALAKLFELNDHAILAATGELFSGHTLKHVVAAFAALPVIAAVAARGRPQNGLGAAAHVA